MKNKNNCNPNGTSWKDLQSALYSPEEIESSKLRVAIADELIAARNANRLTSEELEFLDEAETCNPEAPIDSIMNLLHPLGKTLRIVPISTKKEAI